MDVTLIYTDEAGVDRGRLVGASGDFSVGIENDFELTVPADSPVDRGCYVYIDGEEFGGVVDGVEEDTGRGDKVITGRTWHGIMATRVVCPAAGTDYVEVSGDANACIRAAMEAADAGAPLAGSAEPSGIEVKGYRFDRFVDLYTGLADMLASAGARLDIRFEGGSAVVHAARAATAVVDSDAARFEVARRRACNHLVCLGSGELSERAVLHLFADEQGRVSTTQSIFGAAHLAQVYDYSNAGADELAAAGRKKLLELQSSDSVDMLDEPADGLAVGDAVAGYHAAGGFTVVERVTERIARLDGGQATVECKTGAAQASGTITGSSEASPGGTAALVAGDGILISGSTISAEVTPAALERVSRAAEDARRAASDASSAAGAAQASASEALLEASGKAPLGHAHSYAGSSSAGGPASSAERLAAPRRVFIAGAVSGSATWDGSGDLSITVAGREAAASFLAAHPVGSYFMTSDPADPAATYGGTWTKAPSMGPHTWHREA